MRREDERNETMQGANSTHSNNENPNSEQPNTESLGEALGSAIRHRVETPTAPPPVSHIAERAAARAKARHARQAMAGVAASFVFVAVGITAWNAAGDEQPVGLVVAGQPNTGSDAGFDTGPDAGPNEPDVSGPAEAATPQSASVGPTLTWEELNPAAVSGLDLPNAYGLASTGDGRAIVQSSNVEGNQVLVSANGRDWTPVRVPSEVFVESLDITGERWLLVGQVYDGSTIQHVVRYSDNQGDKWNDIALPQADNGDLAQIDVALVNGENIVVAVDVNAQATDQTAAIIAARGLVSDVSEIDRQTGGPEVPMEILIKGNTVTFTMGDAEPESFELTPEEQAQLTNARREVIRLYTSQGGPAALATEIAARNAAGRSTQDGFELVLFADEGELLVTSSDGNDWHSSLLDESRSTGEELPPARYFDATSPVLWTSGGTAAGVRVERSPGNFAAALIAELPEHIARVNQVAVGPAGVAAFAEPGTPPGLVNLTPEQIEAAQANSASGLEQTNQSQSSLSQWIGWSQDGRRWGWQSLAEALGVPEAAEANVELAVGTDIVIARVETWETTTSTSSDDRESTVGVAAQPARWFIAETR